MRATEMRGWLSLRAAWLPWTLLVVLAAAAPIFYFDGRADGRLAQEHVDRDRIELERKIIGWVVERNPRATIKDFADFPRVLLEVSRANDLDFRVILAVADKESGFRPDAIGKSGEIGLMQVLPATAELVVRRLGLEYAPPVIGRGGVHASLGSLADPTFNVQVGATYLRWQIDRYGFNATALRAYNRHPDRALENRPWDRYAEEVSFRFLALAHAFR